MNLFMVIAALMTVTHLVAAFKRPRLGVIVSGILWCLYLIYEYLIVTEVLCDKNCNIRVDLVFFIPILALATWWAILSYMGRPGPAKTAVAVLGAIGLVVFALVAESYGYSPLSNGVIVCCILAFSVYVIRSRSKSKSKSSTDRA